MSDYIGLNSLFWKQKDASIRVLSHWGCMPQVDFHKLCLPYEIGAGTPYLRVPSQKSIGTELCTVFS